MIDSTKFLKALKHKTKHKKMVCERCDELGFVKSYFGHVVIQGFETCKTCKGKGKIKN